MIRAVDLGFAAVVGVLCGTASAVFLWLLDGATTWREHHEMIVYALPLAGLGIGWVYERVGQSVIAGTNLIIDTIHDEGPTIPLRMTPLVLLGTVLTHLFGGSAGREGAAVQMGASLADGFAHRIGADRRTRQHLLAAGVAGGFGSVFGTPLAGALFGLEFVTVGRFPYAALGEALVAAVVGDWTCRAWGIVHAPYPLLAFTPLTAFLLLRWILFAVAVAATTVVFIDATHALKRWAGALIPRLPLRMFVGGCALVGLWRLAGTSMYLGLGIPTILRAFDDPTLPIVAFGAKLVFTIATIATGFIGGEVTPLFFIGATLGNILARLLALPLPLGAGVGLAAVFASATNTPLALSVMAIELLGPNAFPHVAIVCVVAYLLTGRRSIYPAQRIYRTKPSSQFDAPCWPG